MAVISSSIMPVKGIIAFWQDLFIICIDYFLPLRTEGVAYRTI